MAMTRDEFNLRYQLLRWLTQEGVQTFLAAGPENELCMVHVLGGTDERLSRFDPAALDPEQAAQVREVLSVDDDQVVVTDAIPGFTSFEAWAGAVSDPSGGPRDSAAPMGEYTRLFHASSEDTDPVASEPTPGPSQPAKAPADESVLGGDLPRRPAAGGSDPNTATPGEYTRLFGAPPKTPSPPVPPSSRPPAAVPPPSAPAPAPPRPPSAPDPPPSPGDVAHTGRPSYLHRLGPTDPPVLPANPPSAPAPRRPPMPGGASPIGPTREPSAKGQSQSPQDPTRSNRPSYLDRLQSAAPPAAPPGAPTPSPAPTARPPGPAQSPNPMVPSAPAGPSPYTRVIKAIPTSEVPPAPEPPPVAAAPPRSGGPAGAPVKPNSLLWIYLGVAVLALAIFLIVLFWPTGS